MLSKLGNCTGYTPRKNFPRIGITISSPKMLIIYTYKSGQWDEPIARTGCHSKALGSAAEFYSGVELVLVLPVVWLPMGVSVPLLLGFSSGGLLSKNEDNDCPV